MFLVVDSNILISFFRDNPVRFVIINSKLLGLELISPSLVLEELKNNKQDLLKYSKLEEKAVDELLSNLTESIKIIPKEEFKEFESEAKSLSPHDKDIPFFALSLKLECPIWSNEPEFKKQSRISVFNTKELLKLLSKE